MLNTRVRLTWEPECGGRGSSMQRLNWRRLRFSDSFGGSFEVLAAKDGWRISLWTPALTPSRPGYSRTKSAAAPAGCLSGQTDAQSPHGCSTVVLRRAIIQNLRSNYLHVLIHFHISRSRIDAYFERRMNLRSKSSQNVNSDVIVGFLTKQQTA